MTFSKAASDEKAIATIRESLFLSILGAQLACVAVC